MITVAEKNRKEKPRTWALSWPPNPSASWRNPRLACDVWKKHMSSLLGFQMCSPIMTKSFSRINIKTNFMTVNSLMVKQTQSQSNTWRWRCLLWHVLHYELWMMNHRESILLQFSLGLVTTKFIDTKSVSREPGGYKCKTAIWDIHNLCTLDVVICKKLQRNFNGLEAEKREKNLWVGCLPRFFFSSSKSLLHQKENKKFVKSNKFHHWACNHWEKGNFIFLFQCFIDPVAWFSRAPLHGPSSGRQHCPIQSTKESYFHWSMSFRTK